MKNLAEKLLIIDGNSLANRAFYAIPMLSNSQGFITNAIYGFYNMLVKVLEEEKPEYLVVAFDKGKVVFRHEVYAEYKGTRKGMPDELRPQFPVLKDLLKIMNIALVEMDGFEADDLIGTIVRRGEGQGLSNLIVTGDRDAFQLISPQTKVYLTRKGITEIEIYDEGLLQEKYGLSPRQMIDVKGLMGDASDNIPGIPGIGEKTAVKLVKQYGNLDEVLAHWEDFAGKKLGELLRTYREQALLSKKLATIVLDAPLTLDLAECRQKEPDYPQLIEKLRELEFKNILQNVREKWESINKGSSGEIDSALEGESAASPVSPEYLVLDSEQALREYLDRASAELGEADTELGQEAANRGKGAGKQAAASGQLNLFEPDAPVHQAAQGIQSQGLQGQVAFYVETERKSPRQWQIVACGLKINDEPSAILSWHDEQELASYRALLKKFLVNSLGRKRKIIIHDLKTVLLALHADSESIQLPPGIEEQEIRDTLLLAYLLDPSRSPQDLWSLAQGRLNYSVRPQTVESLPLLLEALAQLGNSLYEELTGQEMSMLYQKVEMPLAFVLAKMEQTGITLDEGILGEMGQDFDASIRRLTEEIFALAGEEINLNSPKQLGVLLFEKLGLAKGKKTKTGYSTGAEVLEALAPEHEIVAKILDYRQLVKLKSTYIDGLSTLREPVSGRVYTTFNQAVTATGRLSSTEPNLQNIPIRMEEGRRIRRAFLPSRGKVLLSADYSQIELRVLAHLACDDVLIEAFRCNQDIHARTASEVFGVPMDAVTAGMRRAAKAVNFGIVYGISDFGLGRDLGISRAEAKEYIENYFTRYQEVKAYLDRTVAEAKEKGYVTTILNRRRYLPDLHSRNFHLRSFAERAAMNTPLQGSAADIIKLAMLKLTQALQEKEPETALLLQVHDELILEVPKEKVRQVGRLVNQMMSQAYPLSVPLKVDLQTGPNWYDSEPLELENEEAGE